MSVRSSQQSAQPRPDIELGRVLDAASYNVRTGLTNLSVPFFLQCRHCMVMGSTGTGKTEGTLKCIAYQHLLHSLPFLAIDPIGGFLDEGMLGAVGAMNRHFAMREMTPFAALNVARSRERHLWCGRTLYLPLKDPSHKWVCNPLCKVSWLTIEEQVDLFLLSLVPLAGDFDQQRRMLSVARAVLVTLMKLAELDGVGPPTLRDVFDFLVATDRDIQFFIARLRRRHEQGAFRFRVRSTLIEAYLEHFFASTDGRERNELVQSFINLLGLVYNDPSAQRFLAGSQHSNIDFGEVVNTSPGTTLLVTLPEGLHTKRLLGSFIMNFVEAASKKRSAGQVKSGAVPAYSILVDEAHTVISQQWGTTISTCRNRGLRIYWAAQSSGQFLGEDGQLLLRNMMANSNTQVFFRLGYDDARLVAASVFKPDGNMVKRVEQHVTKTKSQTVSFADTIAVQISEADAELRGCARTIAIGQSETMSVSKGRSMNRVETDTVTVTQGESWSKATSKVSGNSVTISNGGSFTSGRADGRAQSQSQSSSQGSSFAVFDSSGISTDLGAVDLVSSAAKHSVGGGTARGSSSSMASALSQAISKVFSFTQGRSWGKAVATSRSRSETSTVSGSSNQSEGKAIAKGLSESLSLVEAIGRSVTHSEAQQHSRTKTQGQSRSVSHAETRSTGTSVAVSDNTVYYSVEEETTIRANQLSTLRPRTAWVALNGADCEAFQIETYTMPQQWETKLGGIDYLEDWLERSQPTEPVPLTACDLPERIRVELRQQERSQPALSPKEGDDDGVG